MQSKVSMVVPCYNKVKDIGAMLESVIAQVWDNIELILVNDGSTDGTREVISEYEPKLRARGYEVVIIDQANAGCCAAVYAGLIKITGDYFCLVDCDDSIEPEYVSTMAGWLDEHGDYEWTACSFRPYLVQDGKVEPQDVVTCADMADNEQLLVRHLLRKIITTSWVYMSRMSYVRRCRLIENFCYERRKTYEPLFAVPLMLGGGKLKCFEEDLYRYNRFASDLYSFDSFEKLEKFYDDYSYLYNWSIERADISRTEKDTLLALDKYGKTKDYLKQLNNLDPNHQSMSNRENYLEQFADKATSLIDELFDPKPHLHPDLFKSIQYMDYMNILDEIILKPEHQKFKPSAQSRVIAYGVLGRNAEHFLPKLKGTSLEPELLWDISAETETTISGKQVTKPKFNELKEDDVILVFPKSFEVLQLVQQSARGAKTLDIGRIRWFIFRNSHPEIPLHCGFIYG
ncbi:glycosyltransferase family 2 protein [Paenibacillus soyae]|uniref:Glycosyltransferase family 2 protein n=1 Tax=Paenibacillus soyae TaxID=2969249 RepID=A0A9X2SAI1_9BACL|nr:glycosyltransferase family 2 protein [Paenibacillus soyae]MCR2806719.1 glycosyltransferase family 2 protein [Paenibacillus soyae]